MLIITLCIVIVTLNGILEATDSLSFCPISLVFFKQFATGTQGSTQEKTGEKMGIMTGLRGETETKSTGTVLTSSTVRQHGRPTR